MKQIQKKVSSSAFGRQPGLLALVLAALLSLSFPSCQGDQPAADDRAAQIREEISVYRQEINALNQKVNQLERELLGMGGHLRPNAQVPVSVDTIAPESFRNYFQVGGSVEAVRSARISPEINGHIKTLHVEKGEVVSGGQLLASLSTEVIRQNIQEVRTGLQLAETVYERQKRLWSQEIGSEIQYLEAKNQVESLRSRMQTLESQMALAELRSPIEGIVDEIIMKEGELAMPGLSIMNIVNLEELYINADVSESYLPYVIRGEEVILRFPAYPGEEIHTAIHRVGHVIQPENRTFRMQLRILNPHQRFKPNMMARISIGTYSVDDAVVVPSILIGYDNQGHYVYTAVERDGLMEARRTYIERGPDGEGLTLVKSGLQTGDLLIREGHHRVSSGEPIRIETNKNNMAHGRQEPGQAGGEGV